MSRRFSDETWDGAGRPKRNKFGARKVHIDGVTYDSEGEYRRWCELVALQRAGHITDLARQVSIELIAYGRDHEPARLGARGRFYICDFIYHDAKGAVVYEDFKGCDTALSQLKREMVHAQTGTPVTLTRRVGRRPRGSLADGVSQALVRKALRKQERR